MNKPHLEFHLDLPVNPTYTLIDGYLLFKEEPSAAGVKLQATSGCRGYQHFGAWVLKGKGPLPPSTAIAPFKYTVSTQKLWLPHVKGVEGSFYAIAPFSVSLGRATNRGDFGIHFDANVPGSSGCIVIQLQEHWDIFQGMMAEFSLNKIQEIPLSVIYS